MIVEKLNWAEGHWSCSKSNCWFRNGPFLFCLIVRLNCWQWRDSRRRAPRTIKFTSICVKTRTSCSCDDPASSSLARAYLDLVGDSSWCVEHTDCTCSVLGSSTLRLVPLQIPKVDYIGDLIRPWFILDSSLWISNFHMKSNQRASCSAQ